MPKNKIHSYMWNLSTLLKIVMNLTFQLNPADDFHEPKSISIILVSEFAGFLSVKYICWKSVFRYENIIKKNNYNND